MGLAVDETFVIVRFSPFGPEALQKNAAMTHIVDSKEGRTPPRYGVSVFGDWRREGESRVQVIKRLCAAAHMRGDRIAVTDGAKVTGAGFTVGDDPVEKPAHRLVGTGDLSKEPDYEAMSKLFGLDRMKNPAPAASTGGAK